MRSIPSKTRILAAVFTGGVLIDQATKWWVYTQLAPWQDEVPIIPGFLSIIHAQNTGAAGSMLDDFPGRMYIFAVFTVVAVGVIFDLFRKLPAEDRFVSMTLGLLLSGAVGNAIDRLHKQSVTDFIKVYTDHPGLQRWLMQNFGTDEWPTFNIADSALFVGVTLFLVHHLFIEEDEGDAGASDG